MSIQRMEDMVKVLTKLRPQMLQQFAAAHQNDTYALLAAKAASEEQKKIMAANQPQQMGMPPKVNEQVVASIAQPPQAPQAMPQDQGLPEESGIAQLPAPNMQGMAGGGIVAFSTGGINDVGQYLRSTDGGRTWSIDAPDVVRNPTKPYYSEVANPAAALKGRTFGSRDEAASAYRAAMTSGTPEVSSVRAIDMATTPAAAVNTPTLDAPASNAAPAPASAQTPAGPKLNVDGASAAAPAGPRAPQGGGLTALYKSTLAAQGEATDPYEADRNEVMKSRQAMAGEELKDAQARKEGLAALLGGRESRIKGREDRAEKAENLNTKMAVINAGLAMMQSTGRGLAGIAEGATKGMGMYSEGLKLTAAERQKIEDAKDSFDELRFNSENLTKKEITAAKNKVSEVANMTKEKHIEALMDDRKIKREEATKIFTAEAAAQQGLLNRANQLAVAGMPSGQMQLAAALGKGDIEAGMRKITEIAAGKFSIQQAYADHLKAAGPGMGMTPQDFAAAMRAFTPPKPTTKPSGTAFD